MRPWLSLIVPALNEADGIAAVLAPLQPWRTQGTPGGPVEVIVVDGGSTDATVARAQPLADQVLTAPRGRARQMNAGAAAARGEVLLFLHADTQLPDDAPACLAAALGPGGTTWGRFDVHIEGRSRWLPVVGTMMNLRSRLTGIATGDQALFFRREAFDAVGGFPDQPLMEDIEICRRLRRAGRRPAALRAKVQTSGRRWDQRGAWRTIVLMWRLRWRYWRGESAESIARAYR
jgi:rSAM/selenodomain-associated transferase 2